MTRLPLQQSTEYETALKTLGVRCARDRGVLWIERNLPGLGPLRYVPRGAIPDAQTLCVINAPDRNADPHHRAAGHIPLLTPQTLAILDLRGDEKTLLARQQGKWRNRLRRAMTMPLSLEYGAFDSPGHEWLLQKETMQRRNNHYVGLPHDLIRAYPRGQTCLVQAFFRGKPVAAMLFLLHDNGATYHIGWSGRTGRQMNAHGFLLWRACQILRDRGITHLELGTIDTETAPGLARFKLGSGARPYSLGHTWLNVPKVSQALVFIRRCGAFPSGLLSKGSIGGPRNSQGTPHGSAQYRHHRPR